MFFLIRNIYIVENYNKKKLFLIYNNNNQKIIIIIRTIVYYRVKKQTIQLIKILKIQYIGDIICKKAQNILQKMLKQQNIPSPANRLNDLKTVFEFNQKLLIVETDAHNTIHLKIKGEQKVPQHIFKQKIQEVQDKQKEMTSKAIWIHLNQKNLSYIEFLLEKNYQIHRGIKNSVSLYKWMSSYKDNIPQYSRFYIGCGAAVIRNDHIFLVQEKSGDRKGYFGLPGGRADPGQLIGDATQRQLFQQTGLKGKFQYVLYYRQLPKSLWGASDIYFVSLISVPQQQFQNITLCTNQIAQYKWVHLNEYQQFIKQNGIGSQVHVSKHITQLYRKGYDFNKKSNIAIQKQYKKGSNHIMVQHLCTGIDLLDLGNENKE